MKRFFAPLAAAASLAFAPAVIAEAAAAQEPAGEPGMAEAQEECAAVAKAYLRVCSAAELAQIAAIFAATESSGDDASLWVKNMITQISEVAEVLGLTPEQILGWAPGQAPLVYALHGYCALATDYDLSCENEQRVEILALLAAEKQRPRLADAAQEQAQSRAVVARIYHILGLSAAIKEIPAADVEVLCARAAALAVSCGDAERKALLTLLTARLYAPMPENRDAERQFEADGVADARHTVGLPLAAATVYDMCATYRIRFNIVCTPQQRRDVTAFFASLPPAPAATDAAARAAHQAAIRAGLEQIFPTLPALRASTATPVPSI